MDEINLKRKSFISIICIILIFVLIFTLARYNIYSAELPTCFVNDTPWNDEDKKFQWVFIPSAYYVPITVFELFDFIEISMDRNKKEVTMSSGDITMVFDRITKQFAYKNGVKEYMRTYEIIRDVLWVPAEEVCAYFGFKFEVTEDGKAMRISEYDNKKTLNDILRIYNPALIVTTTITTVTNSIVTETEETPSVTELPPIEIIKDRLIFLTFEEVPSEEVLRLLNEAGINATFFLTGEEILENTDVLRKIIVGRHSVGLHTMTHDEKKFAEDFDSFIAELNQQNDLLYKLIKQKSRIIRAPNGSVSENFEISVEQKQILEDLGYRIWDWNVIIPEDSSAKSVLENAIAGIEKYDRSVIRFHCTKATAEALPDIIEHIKKYEQYKTAAITPAASEVNFVGKY